MNIRCPECKNRVTFTWPIDKSVTEIKCYHCNADIIMQIRIETKIEEKIKHCCCKGFYQPLHCPVHGKERRLKL